jgi:hypothetical protein
MVLRLMADKCAAQITGWVRLHDLQRNREPEDLTGELQRPMRGFSPPGRLIPPNRFQHFEWLDFDDGALAKLAVQQLQQPSLLRDCGDGASFASAFVDVGERNRVERVRGVHLVRPIVATLLVRRVDPLSELFSGLVAQLAGLFQANVGVHAESQLLLDPLRVSCVIAAIDAKLVTPQHAS